MDAAISYPEAMRFVFGVDGRVEEAIEFVNTEGVHCL